jgi:hypothetical protein
MSFYVFNCSGQKKNSVKVIVTFLCKSRWKLLVLGLDVITRAFCAIRGTVAFQVQGQ